MAPQTVTVGDDANAADQAVGAAAESLKMLACSGAAYRAGWQRLHFAHWSSAARLQLPGTAAKARFTCCFAAGDSATEKAPCLPACDYAVQIKQRRACLMDSQRGISY